MEDTNRQRRTTQPVVRFVVEVEPENEPAFTVEDTVTVMLLPAPSVGEYVTVYYNPSDKTDAIIELLQNDTPEKTLSAVNEPDNQEVVDDLRTLTELHERGALTDEEFAEKKAALLDRL